MTLVSLVQASFARNPARSWFTFAAITTAFALFGALETIDYQHDLSPADADIVMVQKDGPGGAPTYPDPDHRRSARRPVCERNAGGPGARPITSN